tara:strand:+ start:8970 stop:9668 length:699 start_codon:yes stop_codon:yes gene_type:complete
MNWQNKIYESLTEARSKKNRLKSQDKKISFDQLKRSVSGKSVGAEGAGRRARREKALAKKASKPADWYAKRHHEGEADRLIAHGKLLAKNKKVIKNLSKRSVTIKGIGEGTGYRRRFLKQASRDDDITSTEAGTIDAAMYAKVWKDTKGQKKLTKRVAKTIAKRREKEKAKTMSENIYDLEKGKMKPKVKAGDPFAHLPKKLKMEILARKALQGGGAKKLAKNIDRSGGSRK